MRCIINLHIQYFICIIQDPDDIAHIFHYLFQVEKLATNHSIYSMKDGRMTLANLKTAEDVMRLGKAIHEVTK